MGKFIGCGVDIDEIGWFWEREGGIEVKGWRADMGEDGVSKYLRGSRTQDFVTVEMYGLFAKRRAQAYVKSIVEVRSPTTWWMAIHRTYDPYVNCDAQLTR